MSTEALLKTRAGVVALRAAFVRGSHRQLNDQTIMFQLAEKLYPYPTGTRPRVVSVAFCASTYKVSLSGSKIRVYFDHMRGYQEYDDIFHLAYTLRMTQEAFDVIQALIANPTETYGLPDDADGAA